MDSFKDILKANRGMGLRIARGLGINHGAVYQWREVPPKRVIEVERITGVSRHELRPDLYPLEAAQ